ncbi:hypothetical protein [Devosia ginsengisoli]|uniref:Permease n=1 Tax=Devosia ginsengisoli TaxID=400770 RepID=A0A5B8LSD4_9HYPH|nr:hypothetical protein [Devosia ginsengisoli]QDZ10402.1 hypothetical protein FPZ08_06340 [Devosia ginsengisoli]
MDFLKLLKSIEELLYELVTWIVFYPLTVVKVLVRPVPMMAYAEAELRDDVDEQYADTVSPPIALLITLFLVHTLEAIVPRTGAAAIPGLLADDNNLIAFRAVAFSIFPLLLAIVYLRQRGTKLTRSSLRPGFYAQCYVALPFVIAFTIGGMIATRGQPVIGLLLMGAGYVWYVAVQTIWQSRDGKVGPVMACLAAIGATLAATAGLVAVTAITGFAIGMVKVP